MALAFQPLYYGDRLTIINPLGDVGLITLWSPQATVLKKLESVAPAALDPVASRIAAVANLYGDGMFAILVNLLYNPQIRHLIAVGQDLGLGVVDELQALLDEGVEDATMFGQPLQRIRGTSRLLPAVEGFDAEVLRERLSFVHLGKVSAIHSGLAELVDGLPRVAESGHATEADRIRVELPDDDAAGRDFRPSDPIAHTVARRTPLACWEELVVRTMRFGQPTQLRKGRRSELLNVKVTIDEPVEASAEVLKAYEFDLGRFHAYQRAILDPALPDTISYTYGNRLREHFGIDGLTACAERLARDPESRGAYVSLWDTPLDLSPERSGPPCLVTLFFRLHGGKLTLTATYRSHNLLTAWLQNIYGLIAVQRFVAEAAGLEPGPITVISHSLTIDPSSPRLAIARGLEQRWTLDDDLDHATGKYSLREDPSGYFVVSVDEDAGELIAEHRIEGLLLKRYRGTSANAMGREIAGDMGVSLVSHALWLGGELQRHEALLRQRRQ